MFGSRRKYFPTPGAKIGREDFVRVFRVIVVNILYIHQQELNPVEIFIPVVKVDRCNSIYFRVKPSNCTAPSVALIQRLLCCVGISSLVFSSRKVLPREIFANKSRQGVIKSVRLAMSV